MHSSVYSNGLLVLITYTIYHECRMDHLHFYLKGADFQWQTSLNNHAYDL